MKVPLRIKVHKALYEFYTNKYGSEEIDINPNDGFALRVKWMLQLYPNSKKKYPMKHTRELVLLLPGKFWIGDGKRVYTEHRGYLDEKRQYYLSKELYEQFKSVFHASVLSYCIAKDFALGCQKDGIYNFIELYRLTLDSINYEMLKKSWDRSSEKSKMLEMKKQKNRGKNTPSPVP